MIEMTFSSFRGGTLLIKGPRARAQYCTLRGKVHGSAPHYVFVKESMSLSHRYTREPCFYVGAAEETALSPQQLSTSVLLLFLLIQYHHCGTR